MKRNHKETESNENKSEKACEERVREDENGTENMETDEPETTSDTTEISDIPLEVMSNILEKVILDFVWTKLQEAWKPFTPFSRNIRTKDLAKNPNMNHSMVNLFWSGIRKYGSVCKRWRYLTSMDYLQKKVRNELKNMEPGVNYRRTVKRLALTGVDPYITPKTLTGWEGNLIGMTQAGDLIRYAVTLDMPNKQLTLVETSRKNLRLRGDINTMITLEDDAEGRVIILSTFIPFTDIHGFISLRLDGSVIAEWVLPRAPVHIFCTAGSFLHVFYQSGIAGDAATEEGEIYDVRGVLKNGPGSTFSVDALLRSRYHPDQAAIFANYEYLMDSRGCAIVADSGRTQLLSRTGRVIQPRFIGYKYSKSAPIGSTLDWLNEGQGIMMIKDMNLQPEIFSVFL